MGLCPPSLSQLMPGSTPTNGPARRNRTLNITEPLHREGISHRHTGRYDVADAVGVRKLICPC